MKMPEAIIPAILSQNIDDFKTDLQKIIDSKNLSSGWIHVDLMDNILVPNYSIKTEDLEGINFGALRKEMHLMVKEPQSWIEKSLKQGFQRIIIHIESEGDIAGYISQIKSSGAEAVLAINPPTPVDTLAPYAGSVDGILVMGVNPGFQGQSFIPETINKIKAIRYKGWPVKIEVDGAVKDWNAKEITAAGANILIVGSFLIKGDPDQNLEILKKTLV